MPVHVDPIPPGLHQHVNRFELPGGAIIAKMGARHYGLDGWVLCPRSVELGEFVYPDGTVGSRPRYRAYEELGLKNGEDDLQGQPDSAWRAVDEATQRFSEQAIADLPSIWQRARQYGYAQRHARQGERVTVRATGDTGEVIDPGTEHDQGHYVRVRLEDSTEHTYPLHRLQLSD